jgi:hypothetical protein
MEQANFMQVIGGHCYICHTDWKGQNHMCGGDITPCTEHCFATSEYVGNRALERVFNQQYKFCPHCGHKL